MIKDNSRTAKFFRYFQLLLVVFMFFISPILTTNARFDAKAQDIVSTPCPVDFVDPNCEPPRIQSLEIIAVRLLYTAWACGGLLFLILLVYVGFLYMTSAGDQGKVETAKKRGGQWIIGILLFFFSQPIVATFMRGLISDNTDCFKDLRDPGFTFFFVDVCTSGDSVNPQPSTSPGESTTPVTSGTPAPIDSSVPTPTPNPAQIALCDEIPLQGDPNCITETCPLYFPTPPETAKLVCSMPVFLPEVGSGGAEGVIVCSCNPLTSPQSGNCAAVLDPEASVETCTELYNSL